MRRYVPFLLLSLFSFPVHAGVAGSTPSTWSQVAPQLSCTHPSGAVQVNICAASKKYFCADRSADAGDCALNTPPVPSTISTNAQLMQALSSVSRTCQGAYSAAHQACEGPFDFSRDTGAAEGIKDICQQLERETDISSRVNSEVTGFCDGRRLRCNFYCGESLNRIKRAAANCPTCNMASLDDLSRYSTACKGFSSAKAKAQANHSYAGSKGSELCKNKSASSAKASSRSSDASSGSGDSSSAAAEDSGGGGMDPSMLMSGLGQVLAQAMTPEEREEVTPPDPVDCATNGNLAGCEAVAEASVWKTEQGTAGLASAEESSDNFNIPDGGVNTASLDPKTLTAGKPATVGGVPNGGGGMPGGAGGAAASLGGVGAGGAVPGGNKSNLDIMHGTSSGGGAMSAMNAGMNLKNGEAGGGFNSGQNQYAQEEPGLDLSQFLPGGKQDPTRKLAGLAGGAAVQIQSRDVNIWARISERIRARCSQGLLRDCVP